MRPVTHDYQSLNEYTLPLQGKPYYRSSGIIYAVDRTGNKYAVGRVDLERFDDQNFQYVFKLCQTHNYPGRSDADTCAGDSL